MPCIHWSTTTFLQLPQSPNTPLLQLHVLFCCFINLLYPVSATHIYMGVWSSITTWATYQLLHPQRTVTLPPSEATKLPATPPLGMGWQLSWLKHLSSSFKALDNKAQLMLRSPCRRCNKADIVTSALLKLFKKYLWNLMEISPTTRSHCLSEKYPPLGTYIPGCSVLFMKSNPRYTGFLACRWEGKGQGLGQAHLPFQATDSFYKCILA